MDAPASHRTLECLARPAPRTIAVKFYKPGVDPNVRNLPQKQMTPAWCIVSLRRSYNMTWRSDRRSVATWVYNSGIGTAVRKKSPWANAIPFARGQRRPLTQYKHTRESAVQIDCFARSRMQRTIAAAVYKTCIGFAAKV